jgi:glycosyltransferase involved in cell wall biosynthesis
MRIAVNTRLLLANRMEGIGRFTHEVAQRLVARRPADEFIFLFDRPFDARYVYTPQVRPLVVPPPARHPLLWYLWFEAAVPYVLNRQRADVFLSMDGYCSLRTTVPTVLVTHDIAHVHYPDQIPGLARQYYDYFVPRYLKKADQIVTVSEFCRQDIHQHYHLPLDKISVAGNAAAPVFRPFSATEQALTRQRYSAGAPYFFYLGAVHPRKNLPRLIQAFDRFKTTSGAAVKLLIGGRFAWQTGSVQAAYDAAAYRSDIHFLGYVPDEELPALVGAALALTYVSLFEGFGVPVLEALHAEVPVLTSDRSSLPEVAGPAALLVDPEDVAAIAQGLLRLYQEPGLRTQLVEKGRQQRTQFTWEKATDVVEAALVKVTTALG